jgi:hypothetical protein
MALLSRVMLLLPFVLLQAIHAQTVTPTLSDSVNASATLDKAIFNAGEMIPLKIHLGIPAPRDLKANAETRCGEWIEFSGTARKGDEEIDLQAPTDKLSQGGECTLNEFVIAPPPQSGQAAVVLATTIKFPKPIQFQILGVPRVSETIDSNISAELNLSERQYLRSRSVAVKSYRESVTSFLDRNANESVALDSFLLQTLVSARDDLLRTRQVFTARYRPKGGYPVFFDDLERRYDALIVDIRTHRAKLSSVELVPHLLRVQELKTRPRPLGAEPSMPSPSLAGTYPPDANETLSLLGWNLDVYLMMANSGKEVFELTIVSLPPDATVAVKRIGVEYITLGQKTTISKAKFDFAIWTFKFIKANCKDYIRDFDPIHDTSPDLEVELDCTR